MSCSPPQCNTPRCSSARAELAGLIHALLNHRPVHVALDNQAVHDKANHILRDPNYQPAKPWMLVKDGDLWHICHRILRQRNTVNTQISKVKGHADQEHVTKGTIVEDDRIKNHAADAIATAAHAIMHPHLIHIVRFAATRQRRYARFVHVFIRFFSSYS